MNIIQLLELKLPYRAGQLDAAVATAELIEWGKDSTSNIGFGSYVTNDGVTSFVAYKKYKGVTLDSHITKCYNVGIIYDKGKKMSTVGELIPIVTSLGEHYLDTKTKWPDESSQDCEVKVTVTGGPVVILRIINRTTLLKYFKRYKNTSNPAPTEVIDKIKAQVEEDDQMPQRAVLLKEFEYPVEQRNELDSDYNLSGPFIQHSNTWTVRLVYYKNRLVLLASPDSGYYRFKPIITIPAVFDENFTVTSHMASIFDILVIPLVSQPIYTRNLGKTDLTLYDNKYKLSMYLLRNHIWPAVIPSRELVAIIQPSDQCQSHHFSEFRVYTSRSIRYMVSRYKNTKKLVVSRLLIKARKKLESWVEGNASNADINNILKDNHKDKNIVWLADGINYDELMDEIKLMYTLKSIKY